MKRKVELGENTQSAYPRKLTELARQAGKLEAQARSLRRMAEETIGTPQATLKTGDAESKLTTAYRACLKILGSLHTLQSIGCTRGNIPGEKSD